MANQIAIPSDWKHPDTDTHRHTPKCVKVRRCLPPAASTLTCLSIYVLDLCAARGAGQQLAGWWPTSFCERIQLELMQRVSRATLGSDGSRPFIAIVNPGNIKGLKTETDCTFGTFLEPVCVTLRVTATTTDPKREKERGTSGVHPTLKSIFIRYREPLFKGLPIAGLSAFIGIEPFLINSSILLNIRYLDELAKGLSDCFTPQHGIPGTSSSFPIILMPCCSKPK